MWPGAVAAALAPPALAAVLDHLRGGLNLTSTALLFLAAVVAVARLGGMLSALAAALWASVLLNYYFVFPLRSTDIANANDAVALAVFVVVALTVASVVDLAARQSRRAARANAEAETLNVLALSVLRGDGALDALLDQLRTTFQASAVSLLQEPAAAGRRPADPHPVSAGSRPVGTDPGPARSRPSDPYVVPAESHPGLAGSRLADQYRASEGASPAPAWLTIAASGIEPPDAPERADTLVPVEPGTVLALRGRVLGPAHRHVLSAFTAQATAALERGRLAESAARAANLQAADAMRTALLAAVSHDLRTPLAAARAAVNTLADAELSLGRGDREELLEIAEDSLTRLTRLVEDLLDMSRLQAGAMSPRLAPLDVHEVLAPALESLDTGADRVRIAPQHPDIPQILADGPLLERAVANLLSNAIKHTDSRIEVSVEARADATVRILIADRGPGIPPAARDQVFRPFQRLGDRDNHTGVGLGLALARGLTACMGGTLEPEDTPGGGLTMVLTMPAAEPVGRIEPAEAAEAVEAVEAVEAAESTEPIEPPGRIGTAEPVEPVRSVESAEPFEPAEDASAAGWAESPEGPAVGSPG